MMRVHCYQRNADGEWENQGEINLPAIHVDHMRELVERGNHIEAIKYLRSITNCGLKEAKDAIESYFSGKEGSGGIRNPRNDEELSENVKKLLAAGKKNEALQQIYYGITHLGIAMEIFIGLVTLAFDKQFNGK